MHRDIEAALEELDESILRRSGSVFYSGLSAFSKPSQIYVLGLNPGGAPARQAEETVCNSISRFRNPPRDWSAYSDESWQGAEPGTWGMQPRVLHIFKALALQPRFIPASNVVFVRSSTEMHLRSEKEKLLKACWPVHAAIIEALQIQTILCFGSTAGKWVRECLSVHEDTGSYRETNKRGWTSKAHRGGGVTVITLTHPSRADWRNPAADPSEFVRRIAGL